MLLCAAGTSTLSAAPLGGGDSSLHQAVRSLEKHIQDVEVFVFAGPPVLAVPTDQEDAATLDWSGSFDGSRRTPRLTSHCFAVEEDPVTCLSVGTVIRLVLAMRAIDGLDWGLWKRVKFVCGLGGDSSSLEESRLDQESLVPSPGFVIPAEYRLRHLSCRNVCCGKSRVGDLLEPNFYRIETLEGGRGELSRAWGRALAVRLRTAVTGTNGGGGSGAKAGEESPSPVQTEEVVPSLLLDERYRVVRMSGYLGEAAFPITYPSLVLNHFCNFYEDGLLKAMRNTTH